MHFILECEQVCHIEDDWIDLLTLCGTKAPSGTRCLVLAEHLRNTNMAEEKKENNNKNKKFRKQTLWEKAEGIRFA